MSEEKVKRVIYKIWSEVEKITEYEDGMEEYEDMEMPMGITYRESEEEARKFQEEIRDMYTDDSFIPEDRWGLKAKGKSHT